MRAEFIFLRQMPRNRFQKDESIRSLALIAQKFISLDCDVIFFSNNLILKRRFKLEMKTVVTGAFELPKALRELSKIKGNFFFLF